eukprot:GHVU01113658.1.p1 GENE.GHVU01113658.1~~GHVU01113658.1.p1  ORF type:complete len:125 (+),score=5.91 GHVU01113658.1:298-672(+)
MLFYLMHWLLPMFIIAMPSKPSGRTTLRNEEIYHTQKLGPSPHPRQSYRRSIVCNRLPVTINTVVRFFRRPRAPSIKPGGSSLACKTSSMSSTSNFVLRPSLVSFDVLFIPASYIDLALELHRR